ncbi:MAG: hypothetical protein WDO72_07375 [Pseudomonadota bacterium]
MKAMILSSVMLAIAGGTGLAHGADASAAGAAATNCTYRAEPSTAAGPIAQSETTLISVAPAAGGDVRRDSVIVFDVEYRIKDFVADRFFLMPLFKTAGLGSSAPGGPSDYPYLATAAGKVHMCVPLAEMYDKPTMEWPLTVEMHLMQSRPDGSSIAVASARKVKFNSLDIPAGTFERQADRPVEYYDALGRAWDFFEKRLAQYKACNQHFADRQPALIKAYRSWEARHSDTLRFVSDLQFDEYLHSSGGDAARATYLFDAVRATTLDGYSQMPVQMLRQQCELALSEFSDSEDPTDNIIEDEVAYLRKWHAARKKAAP